MEPTASFPNGALATLAQQGALLKRNLREPIPIESRRIALERMVTLEFPHLGHFLAEYSANISMTGMFIQTARVQRPGTLAAFELNLTEGESPVSGEAEVVWRRRRAQGPDLPAGMGLRFLGLDGGSREQIRRAVEKRSPKDGDSPGSEAPAPVEESQEPEIENNTGEEPRPARSETVRPAPVTSRLRSYAGTAFVDSTRWRWQWIPFVLLAGLFVAAVMYLSRGRPWDPMNAQQQETGPTSSAVAKPAPSPSLAASSPATPVAPAEAALDMVASWAGAWSAQRAETYLSFYAETFRPPSGRSLADWQQLRRERISRPDNIEVEITDLEVELLGTESARVSFQQGYAADHYRDSVRKILELVLEDGEWKIQVERVAG